MATALKSKPGLTGATALSIPATWDATWFRHFIHNMLKGADVRNAVGVGGVTVTGNISSPYATIGFNGSTGLVITDGTHTVNGVTSIQFSGAVVSGVSPNGVVTISASGGVTSVTGTTNEIVATPTTGAVVLSFAPNIVIPAPASGDTLVINSVSGGNAITLSQGATHGTGGIVQNAVLVPTLLMDSSGADWGQIFNSATQVWALGYGPTTTANGTAALTWNATGNITIPAPSSGTTLTVTGLANSSIAALFTASAASNQAAVTIDNPSANGSFMRVNTNGTTIGFLGAAAQVTSGSGNDLALTSNGAQQLILGTNQTNRITISSSGNVTVAAPSSGTAFTANGAAAAGVPVALIQGSTTAGARGLTVLAGNSSSDYCFISAGASSGANFLLVYGDGSVTLGAPTGGALGIGTINATGYYLNGVLLATPTTGTSSQSATGFAATVPTVTLAYTIVGKSVTLYIPAISGTSNSAGFGINIPAAITPATTKNTAVPLYGWTNGGAAVNIVGAGAQVGSGGNIAFFITGGSSWTASGTKASPAMSITYDLT